MQKLIFTDEEGAGVIAPVEVWLGAVIGTMPDDIRHDVIRYTKAWMTKHGLDYRLVITPETLSTFPDTERD